MKMRNKLFLFLVYQFAFLAWCFKIHKHFFEFTIADQIGLTAVALLPLLLFQFKLRWKMQYSWLMLAIFPIAIFPMIEFGLLFVPDVWILLYLSLFASGILVFFQRQNPLTYLSLLSLVSVWFLPFSFEANQHKYFDRLIQTISTRNGEIDVVTWKNEKWYYYNNSLVSSTIDGHMHAEVLAHTTIPYFKKPDVLLIGDDFGLTKKEVNKYECDVFHLPYDVEMVGKLNHDNNDRTSKEDIRDYLEIATKSFEVIIIDLPDPEHLPFKAFYEHNFFLKCLDQLTEDGIIITNSGGYYTNAKHYQEIERTLVRLGLNTQLLQALIPTLGHRTWIMASKKAIDLSKLSFNVPTTWINEEAIQLMLSKGNSSYPF